MSTVTQKRQAGKIVYQGECSDCETEQVVGLPPIQKLVEDPNGQWIRCPDCSKINYWRKAADA